jgi:histidinol-phosphate aminotransferase
MAIEFSAAVSRIPVYPAAGAYALPEDVAMMASNESPEPPLEPVVAAIAAILTGVNRYPDPTNAKLRGALSDRYDVPASRIAIGNGSCDILLAAGEALLEPGAELVYAWPSFSVYPHLAAATGATEIPVALNAAQEHDLDAMLAQITAATRLVIVCNPNNPTSTAVGLADIAAFVAKVPKHVCVLLDEAYCEYNTLDDPDASLDLLDKHPNLVLLRTFSKVYGLCGLRVGYALCGSDAFVTAVNQVRQPFFCGGRVAQARRRGRGAGRARDRRAPGDRGRPRRAGHRRGGLAGQLRVVRPPRRGRGRPRRGGGRDRPRPRRARRARARRRGARPARRAARHLRHAGAEPALPSRPARAASVANRHNRGFPTSAASAYNGPASHVPLPAHHAYSGRPLGRRARVCGPRDCRCLVLAI